MFELSYLVLRLVTRLDNGGLAATEANRIQADTYHIIFIGQWIGEISHILLAVTLYELGRGVLYAFGQPIRDTPDKSARSIPKVGRYLMLGIAGVLLVLAVAYYGMSEAYLHEAIYGFGSESWDSVAYRGLQIRRLGATIDFLQLVVSVALLAYGWFVMMKSKTIQPYRKVSFTYSLW
jgi:hypothetical protein